MATKRPNGRLRAQALIGTDQSGKRSCNPPQPQKNGKPSKYGTPQA